MSILALVNVMFIPTTDMGVDFFEAIQKLLAYPRGYIDAWYSGFALAIFIPALFMLVVSFFRNRMLHILASGIGIISLGKEMMEYHSQIGLFQSSSIIAIGSWIGMILFIIGVIIQSQILADPVIQVHERFPVFFVFWRQFHHGGEKDVVIAAVFHLFHKPPLGDK